MNDLLKDKKEFFTLESREESRYTEFKRKYRLYTRKGEFLPSARYIYDRLECPPKKGLSSKLTYLGKPTEEQYHVIRTINKRIKEFNYGCGLIIMGTGKGKGHVAMQITTLLQTKTLILCHNVQTLLEMIAKFKAFTNITPGVYYGAKKNIQEVTITTHKSFIELGGQMGDFDVIIYDECDFSLDTNMIQALAKSGAHYLYGMTGTPYKKELNTEDFERIYGKRIVCQTVKKYNIVPESITVYRYKAAEPYIYENWAEQRAAMFNNEERRTYQISLIKKHIQDANAALVISDRVEDTENLFTALQKEGIKVGLINGNTKPKDDKIIIEAIEKKELQVIIGTSGKIARGVDIPIIDTIFMYATVQFEGSIVQAVGRALREHKLKKRVTVIDFSDDECRNQRYQRVKAYQKEYGIPPTSIYIIKPPKHDTNHSLFLN